jgi:toxin ParE1/3/4
MRQRAVIFSDQANIDLRDIYNWLADQAGPFVALAYVERISAFIHRLDLASERGTRRNDLMPGLRIIGFERRVTIAFTVDQNAVTILRVFYGGKDWEDEWDENDPSLTP